MLDNDPLADPGPDLRADIKWFLGSVLRDEAAFQATRPFPALKHEAMVRTAAFLEGLDDNDELLFTIQKVSRQIRDPNFVSIFIRAAMSPFFLRECQPRERLERLCKQITNYKPPPDDCTRSPQPPGG